MLCVVCSSLLIVLRCVVLSAAGICCLWLYSCCSLCGCVVLFVLCYLLLAVRSLAVLVADCLSLFVGVLVDCRSCYVVVCCMSGVMWCLLFVV